jgi:Zn finger protein HypA/HybF involved in hydrogenase expression
VSTFPNNNDKAEQMEVYCLRCDETFFAFAEEEPTCPKCGAKDDEWLTVLPTQVDEHEGKGQEAVSQPIAP